MKSKTKIFLGSALTIAMCASLITGSTLALFTSESKTNIAVTSGKVDVTATIDADSLETYSYKETSSGTFVSTNMTPAGTFETGGTARVEEDGSLTLSNIVPGDKAEFNITIANNSSVDVQYQYAVSVTGETVLFDKLEVAATEEDTTIDFVKNAFIVGSSSTKWSAWEAGTAASKTVHISVGLPYPGDPDVFGSAGSIQGKTCELTFTVNATQGNAKTQDPSNEPGKLSIFTLQEFKAFAASTAEKDYAETTISLKTDIDFNELSKLSTIARTGRAISNLAATRSGEWTPIGTSEHPFKGTFDGEDHVISNLSATGANAGLFGTTEGAAIKNLTIANASVTADGENAVAGILVAEAKGALTVTNVSVESSTIMKAEGVENATVGALVGKASDTVTVTNVDIKVNEGDAEGAGDCELVGEGSNVEYQGKSELTVSIANGFTEKIIMNDSEERRWYEVSGVEGLVFFAGSVNEGNSYADEEGNPYTVCLTEDVNLEQVKWIPAGTDEHPFSGKFVGGTVAEGVITEEQKTISNLTVNLTAEDNVKYAGLFGVTKNCEISDLILSNISITNRFTAEKNGEPNLDARNGGLIGIAHGNATVSDVKIESGTVTSPKTAAGFIGEAKNSSAVGAKVTLTNCENHANICSPKATGFVSQIENSQIFMTNCDNYGNISMPEAETDVTHKDDNRDVIMGAFIGYCMAKGEGSLDGTQEQGGKDGALIINCDNYGNITAEINYWVNKINIGGLISSTHGGWFVLVDCVNNGDVTVNQNCADTTYPPEIGGLIGSSGATMYHVEQLGDITVTDSSTTIGNGNLQVGGIVGSEDKGNLHLFARSSYKALAAESDASERNVVFCTITVTYRSEPEKILIGAATGKGHEKDTIDATDIELYIVVNGQNRFDNEPYMHGLTGNNVTYKVTDSSLKLSSIPDFGFEYSVRWGADDASEKQ